jgi:outer membrane protein assembly factor BamB
MATPLLMDGLLYVVRWNGILVCLNPENGDLIYEERLPPGAYTASPVGGDGKLYLANEDGTVIVVRAGREFSIVSQSQAHDPILASPALSEGVFYLRTSRELLAVGE